MGAVYAQKPQTLRPGAPTTSTHPPIPFPESGFLPFPFRGTEEPDELE